MSLTPQQITLIQASFSKVEPIADQAAEIFYSKLFEYDPSLKPLFKSNMKDQGRKLMSTLKVAVSSLTDLDKLVPVLQGLAVKHVDYGVKVEDYTPVGNALLNTLQAGLGSDFDQKTRQAWTTGYQTIADVMRSAAYPGFSPGSYRNTKIYNKP